MIHFEPSLAERGCVCVTHQRLKGFLPICCGTRSSGTCFPLVTLRIVSAPQRVHPDGEARGQSCPAPLNFSTREMDPASSTAHTHRPRKPAADRFVERPNDRPLHVVAFFFCLAEVSWRGDCCEKLRSFRLRSLTFV
uniref:(northern house mosquito) hypothetical protein n=1 Tax=Culex pipiens TaxID=7175 RepID=A0A8D8C8D9_CULPI